MNHTGREGRLPPRALGTDTMSREADPTLRAPIENTIFELLSLRKEGSTICPSEVARALAPDDDPWRALMPRIRQVAQDLARNQRLRVTRRGVPVDATTKGGPIRLGLPREPGDT
jgi:hypothetical protein